MRWFDVPTLLIRDCLSTPAWWRWTLYLSAQLVIAPVALEATEELTVTTRGTGGFVSTGR